MTFGRRIWLFLAMGLNAAHTPAAEPQNPSPMVEHTREHRRLVERVPDGRREKGQIGTWFVPPNVTEQAKLPLLVFFHGGTWMPEVAAEKSSSAVWHVQQAGGYAGLFAKPGSLVAALQEGESRLGLKWSRVTVGGWSAGCAAIREMLLHQHDAARIDSILLIDGVHATYVRGKPGPKESTFETEKLAGLVQFSRQAMDGKKRLLLLHTEIFPGTFASTTETADWLLRELNVKRKPVLKWGPMGTQQLSHARQGGFHLAGFAGNSAPDHVDLLHGLPEFLRWIEEAALDP